MSQTARYQETLRRLAMIDEGFVEDEAGLGLDLARTSTLEPKTAALLQLGILVASGSSAVCLEWSTARALAAGATEDEIAGVLPAIAPVIGLGRVVCAAPDMATALGYDVEPHWRNQTIRNSRQSVTPAGNARKSKIRERENRCQRNSSDTRRTSKQPIRISIRTRELAVLGSNADAAGVTWGADVRGRPDGRPGAGDRRDSRQPGPTVMLAPQS